jgi:hypothetical protein
MTSDEAKRILYRSMASSLQLFAAVDQEKIVKAFNQLHGTRLSLVEYRVGCGYKKLVGGTITLKSVVTHN